MPVSALWVASSSLLEVVTGVGRVLGANVGSWGTELESPLTGSRGAASIALWAQSHTQAEL